MRGHNFIPDCAVVWRLNFILPLLEQARILNAATGWDFTAQELKKIALRAINLAKVFNVKHGHT